MSESNGPSDPRPAPNIRLRPNVVCLRLADEAGTVCWDFGWADRSVLDRLFFWDLLELSRAFPDRVASHRAREASLTPRQLSERHAFLRNGIDGHSLWPAGLGRYVSFRWPGVTRSEAFPPAPPPGPPPVARPPAIPATPPTPPPPTRAETAPEVPVTAPPAAPPSPPPSPAAPPRAPAAPAPPPTEAVAGGPDADQREVVAAPVDARMIVLAPPGTGKTHTLIERVRHLVRSGGVASPAGITVLSFTRAAVAEIVSRVSSAVAAGEAGDDLRYVTVRTFDSFATHALIRDTSGTNLPGGGHEARIREFTRRLETNSLSGAAAEQIAAIRCLLVDEVQDLVGVRGRLVRALARVVLARGGGVMLFGDFAQAIYDYQEGADGYGSVQFLAGIREVLGPTRREVTLGTDHRSTTDQVRRFVRSARDAMGADGTSPSGIQLARLIHELGIPAALDVLRAGGERVAVLTRTNLQAYHVADWCRREGIPVETVRGSSASYAPAWIARLVAGYTMEVMGLATAESRWADRVGGRAGLTFEQAVDRLRAAGAVDGPRILLPRLNLAVHERRPALVARPLPPGVVAVSTIHRSKGLEFDSVFLLQHDQWQGKPEEVRVVYVAATRARACFRLLGKCDRDLGIRSQWFKSPVRAHHHRYTRETNLNELFLDGLEEIDLDSLGEDLPGSAAAETSARQEALWQAALPGTNCYAHWSPDGRVLTACHGGTETPVCFVSDPLEADLAGLTRAYGLSRPELFDVKVHDLATVAFPPDDEEAARLFGPARIALAPVVQGWAGVVGR